MVQKSAATYLRLSRASEALSGLALQLSFYTAMEQVLPEEERAQPEEVLRIGEKIAQTQSEMSEVVSELRLETGTTEVLATWHRLSGSLDSLLHAVNRPPEEIYGCVTPVDLAVVDVIRAAQRHLESLEQA